MSFAYLFFNLAIIGSVIFFALIPITKIAIPDWRAVLVSLLTVSGFFVIWDILVAGQFWYFVKAFVLGPELFGLPFEEWLFFLTVPYALLFLWEQLQAYDFAPERWKWPEHFLARLVVPMLQIASILVASYATWQGWWYTATVSIVFFVSWLLVQWVAERSERFSLGGCRLWNFLGFTIVLTLIFNGYLTWEPIVVYNDLLNSGLRVGTIPVEDVVYGLSMALGLVGVYEWNRKENLY